MKILIRKIITLVTFILFSCVQNLIAQNELVQTIYFQPGSFNIGKKYKIVLEKVARRCNKDTSFFLKVFGYADKSGSKKDNDELSEKRATTVFNYLQSHTKIDTAKVYITWLGESDEAYDLHFNQAHVQERCVDVWIVFYDNKKAKKATQLN